MPRSSFRPSRQRFGLAALRAWLASALVGALAISCIPAAQAATPAAASYVAGRHYQVLTTPVRTNDPRKIEVVEVFSYGCNHCFAFEPAITAWRARQPADVDFQLVPAMFNPQFRTLGQGFYAAKRLNLVERSHNAVFKAIHEQGRPLWLMSELATFYSQYGVSDADFTRTMQQADVLYSVQRADSLARSYQITGVPAMVVNGKYLVSGAMLTSNNEMLRVVDFLVAKERATRRPAAARPAAPRPAAPARPAPAAR